MKTINIKAVRIDGGTQARVEINNDVVADYAEAIRAGVRLPPLVVFHDGADYWLADGFHRWHALSQAGKTSADVEVMSGTVRSAILYSLGANGAHGLRRTNADKRKAVDSMLADAEWSNWSDHKIADACGVSQPFVSGIRTPKPITVISQAPKKQAKEAITVITPTAAKPTPKPEVDEEGAPDQAEFDSVAAAAKAEEMAMRLLLASDEPLADVTAKYQQALLQIEQLSARIVGLQNQSTHQIKTIKSLQAKLKKLEQPA